MTTTATGSPGSHPHADQPNWKPSTTLEDYLSNCREGLEVYSERRAAKLMGASRAELWRWKLMAELPDELFDALLKAKEPPSTKSLAAIALALKNGHRTSAETCPRCGGTLRVRQQVSAEYREIMADWLKDG